MLWQVTYAPLKRSLEILGDNLRLKLVPFGVKVVLIITGAVESKVHSYHQEWKLPDTSLYVVFEESFTKRAKGDNGSPRMDKQTYAKGVVSKLLANPGPKF
ncbi:hypothetical protein P171DRAFT_488432 [Karstenula rhodostoma CBS 690.94]|uniref:Uncharacterized protein n=1 Tax=Karstenula rhodostoma CBS 690.94 TaxID=1392251 RepID=A0A9P4U9A2_9PLEO|nr:hypothetical protein P171DRAFT_488432 [Karstenula rhodostoma CBS 690.94]